MDYVPSEIKLQTKSRQIVLSFEDGNHFDLPFEYLRVHSPSADVQGHGPGQEILQKGKENVIVTDIQPVGHYAVRLIFDDGHDSGLFTWEHLYGLGKDQESRWTAYLDRLQAAGYARQPITDA